ncbi:hypothetical protein [Glutamicibacter endophyticus]|uniref:hypothetical protein n=1 Tax=Glutamicibacter endophyticus TaxID=1522174 RepID=UPI003AF05095
MFRSTTLRALGVTAVVSLALASCSSSSPTTEQSNPSVATPSVTPTSSQTPAASDKNDPLDNGGHAEYTWEDFVEAKKKASGLSSWPDVERIRFVSQEDWASEQAQCMTNLGFPSTLEDDGSFSTKITEVQEQAAAEARYTCELQYPMDLKYSQAFTRTQLHTIYAHYRDSLIPCLKGLGFEPGELPSEETYVEGTASGANPWTPYDAIDLSSADVNSMNQNCPSMPAAEELYGN